MHRGDAHDEEDSTVKTSAPDLSAGSPGEQPGVLTGQEAADEAARARALEWNRAIGGAPHSSACSGRNRWP